MDYRVVITDDANGWHKNAWQELRAGMRKGKYRIPALISLPDIKIS